MKRNVLMIAGCLLSLFALAACGGKASESSEGKETITFINHKTDWETNGTWDKYIAKFNEKYPDIEVKYETITDYVGQMKTRLNSTEYGDVLMIPGDVSADDYSNFF